MNIKAMILVGALALTGCSSVKEWIPSFWDDNQSKVTIDLRQSVNQLDCSKEHLPQIVPIKTNLEWLQLYSESKKTTDVMKLIKPMTETVDDFYNRSKQKQGSTAYCELKKKLMVVQARAISETILRRF